MTTKVNLPESWQRLRLKDCLDSLSSGARPTGGSEAGSGEVFSLGGEHINDQGGFDWSNPQYVPWSFYESIREDAEVAVNDILINKDGAKTGKLAIVREGFPHEPCCINEHVFRLRADTELADPRFLFYSLLAHHGQTQITRTIQGSAQGGINKTFAKQVYVYFPTQISEQQCIADVLVLTDDAIAAAEAKLTAARRLKTALMQQLFTRGIPGRHSRFRQTKIGEIPKGWEVERMSRILSEDIYNGISPLSRPEPPGRPILNVSCISAGKCDPAYHTYVDIEDEPDPSLLSKPGDFYVLRGNGNRAYVATGGLLIKTPPEGSIFSDLLIKIPFAPEKTAEGFMPLLWQSQRFLHSLQSKAVSGSGLWKIGLREIRRHEFPLPPMEEQKEIVDLFRSCDQTIDACETEVECLHRLKRSLLQNLLTGHVRVRMEAHAAMEQMPLFSSR